MNIVFFICILSLILNSVLSQNDILSEFESETNDQFPFKSITNAYNMYNQLMNMYNNGLLSTEDVFKLMRLNLTATCRQKAVQFVNATVSREQWALKIIDQWGKPSSGIMNGAYAWLGEYSGCLDAVSSENSWETKYCVIKQPDTPTGFTPVLQYGVCFNTECNLNDMVSLINFALEPLLNLSKGQISMLSGNIGSISVKNINCVEEKEYYPITIITIILITVIAAIILTATLIVEYFDSTDENLVKKDKPNKWLEICTALSLIKNAEKIMVVKKNPDQFDCLHGIRFLSLAWVIYGHTYMISLQAADNSFIAANYLKQFFFLLIFNATFSVDTFFILGGFLTSFLFIKEATRSKLSFFFMFKYYFHRIWRITPPYMLVLMVSAFLSRNLGNGPLYPKDGLEINMCHNAWWRNLLYINNFFDVTEGCLTVSWSLANDTQFHFIAPLILIPFALKKRTIGIVMSAAFLIANILSHALIIHSNPGYEYGMANLFRGMIFLGYFKDIYVAPWCRIGPFVIGILLGYVVHVQKTETKFPKLKWMVNIPCWLLTFGLCLLMIFGIHQDLVDGSLSTTARILYQVFSRLIWSCGISYIIYACISKNGGIVNRILSLDFWVPLSRLTYMAYLIHFPLTQYFVLILERPQHLDHLTILYMFFGNISLSYALAFVTNLFFEAPFIGIEKYILPRH